MPVTGSTRKTSKGEGIALVNSEVRKAGIALQEKQLKKQLEALDDSYKRSKRKIWTETQELKQTLYDLQREKDSAKVDNARCHSPLKKSDSFPQHRKVSQARAPWPPRLEIIPEKGSTNMTRERKVSVLSSSEMARLESLKLQALQNNPETTTDAGGLRMRKISRSYSIPSGSYDLTEPLDTIGEHEVHKTNPGMPLLSKSSPSIAGLYSRNGILPPLDKIPENKTPKDPEKIKSQSTNLTLGVPKERKSTLAGIKQRQSGNFLTQRNVSFVDNTQSGNTRRKISTVKDINQRKISSVFESSTPYSLRRISRVSKEEDVDPGERSASSGSYESPLTVNYPPTRSNTPRSGMEGASSSRKISALRPRTELKEVKQPMSEEVWENLRNCRYLRGGSDAGELKVKDIVGMENLSV